MPLLTRTHRLIITIAIPMMIASCSVPLLGLVDTAILGHLEHARYLAAVAAGSSIMTFISWLFAFLRMGNTGLTAQALGRGDAQRNWQIMVQSTGLGLFCGLILILLSWPILQGAVTLITPAPDIRLLTYEYCQIRIFAAPASLATSAALGWLLGNSRASSCVAILLVTNLTNIGLDFLLIVGLNLNSAGAAWASFFAEWVGFVVALWLVWRVASALPASQISRLFTLKALTPLLSVNQHLFFRTCCIVFTMAFFNAQGARLGETILAANAILIQLLLLVAYTQDGFANAAEALTGRAIGMGNLPEFFTISRLVVAWGFTLAVIATLVLALWPHTIIGIFTSLPDVNSNALRYWPWLVMLPLASVFCFMADGIFIGTGKTADMLSTTFFATFIIFLPCWYLSRSWGNDGLWFSYLIFLFSRSCLLGWAFYRHTRQHNWLKTKPGFIE